MKGFGLVQRRALWLACAVMYSLGCEREVVRPGQLIVAVDTDMALPDQVDTLHIRVDVEGRRMFERDFELGPGSIGLTPATLTLYAREDAAKPVTVQVSGSRATPDGVAWTTFREATIPLPSDRVVTLPMPLQWLCKGQVEPDENVADGQRMRARSTCGERSSCRAGRCMPNATKVDELPDYAPEEIFGGGATPEAGSCFDTLGCLARAQRVEPDATCSFPEPDAEHINVALRVLDDGICDAERVNCYVPLNGESEEGWVLQRDRIQLPESVCEKLDAGQVRAVVVADACETKTESVPACGAWSRVNKGPEGKFRPPGDPQPRAKLLIELPSAGDAADSDRCCPLMAAGGKLYTCVCVGSASGTVFEIDPAAPDPPRPVGTLNPSSTRKAPLAARVFDSALYWAARTEVRLTPLSGSTALANAFAVPGPFALYETGSLLTDDEHVYALASGGGQKGDAAVQLFRIARAGSAARTVPIGELPVYQFDHDGAALYVVADRDELVEGEKRRSSSVLKIDKQSLESVQLMPERTLRITDGLRGGYLGVQVEEGQVYALYEAPAADGVFELELQRIAADAAGGTAAERLYAAPLDPARRRMRLLGAADGGALLVRLELEGELVVGSSLLAVPAAGGPAREIADFVNDYPLDGLARDADHVYWLNDSGRLYALARTALRQ